MSKMFYEDAASRWKVINAAIDYDQNAREKFEEIRDHLHGKIPAATNPAWEFITLVLSQLIYQNPDLAVESRIPGEPELGAIGLKYTLESLLARQGWSSVWERCFSDSCAWRGVSIVSTEQVMAPRYTEGLELIDWRSKDARKIEDGEEITQPTLNYIPPDAFFLDAECRDVSRARFMGHSWTDSLARLRKLAEDEDSDYDKDALKSASGPNGSRNPDALKVLQMFVPNYLDPEALDAYDGDEDPLNDGLHTGTIYTQISEATGAVNLRTPRLYRGPACGPYQVYDAIQLPGDRSRTAPLAAALPQINRLASVGEAVIEAAESYQTITLATEEVVKALTTSPTHGLYSVGISSEAFKDAIQKIEVGGMTTQLIEIFNIYREALDKTLGISDTQRGIATSGSTATAEELANRSTDVKLSLFRNGLYQGTERGLHVAGWHVLHAHDFYEVLPADAGVEGMRALMAGGMDIDPEALKSMKGKQLLYAGGDALGEGAENSYDGMMVKITPMSMERTSEGLQQRRAMGMLEMIGKIAELQAAIPGFDGRYAAKRFSGMMNMPGLEELLPDNSDTGGPVPQGGGTLTPDMTGLAGNQSGAMAAGSVQ